MATTKTPGAVAVPCFKSVEALQDGLVAKREFMPVDLYPRDGTLQLCELEARVAYLARAEAADLVLFNTGMSAIQAAVEVILDRDSLLARGRKAPVLAYSRQPYSQTAKFLGNRMKCRGIKVVSFDCGSTESIRRVIDAHQPDIIFSETVGNGPDVPVLDTAGLRAIIAERLPDSTLILDNTLPLSTALPLAKTLRQDERLLVIESGTKSYTLNNEVAGLVYTRHAGLLKDLRTYRRETGTMPGLGSLDRIGSILPQTRRAFDERNRRLYQNTQDLALTLYEPEGAKTDWVVAHPGLPTHRNHKFVKEHYPHGVTPLLFLQCTGTADQFALARRLWEHPGVREHADLGQSFGFDRARILPREDAPAVRIASGAHTDVAELGKALKEAAYGYTA